MVLIIAGSRTLNVSNFQIKRYLEKHNIKPTTIISGGARGIDSCAEDFAQASGYWFKLYRADWEKHGKAAGYIRNKEMATAGEALLLIWDGKSKGSKHMRDLAAARGLPIFEEILEV